MQNYSTNNSSEKLLMYSFPDDIVITSSDKFYFTCPSFGFISPILSLIDKIISNNPEINVIVMDEQMRLFWEYLITNKNLGWNLIFLNTQPPGRYRDVLSWFKIKTTIRKLFDDNFKSVKSSYFYCCGPAVDTILFSLVKLIAMNNTVVFLNIFYSKPRKCYSLKGLLLLIHTWLFYRINVSIRCYDFDKSPFVYLSERYFKKLNTQLHEFNYFYDASLLQKYNPIPARYTIGKKIMWLDDDCSYYDRKMQGQILNCFKAIKSIIDENFTKNEVSYKPHPDPNCKSKNLTSIYSDYDELPSFMNADFIISNPDIKYILGCISAVLSTAAKNTNIIVISYLNLMPFKDQEIKKSMVELWNRKSCQRILYIDSLEELNILFKNGGNW